MGHNLPAAQGVTPLPLAPPRQGEKEEGKDESGQGDKTGRKEKGGQ